MFMKKKCFVSLLILFFIVFCSKFAFAAQDNLKYQEDQIVKKMEQLKEIQLQIDNIKQESDNIHTKFDLIDKDNKNKQLNHEKAKESYNRASQNVDIINPEQMAQLLRAYQQTTKELKESNEELTKVKNDKNYIEEKLQNLTNKKNQTEIEILQIKADIFEAKSREPLWVEGEGEAILDENKTMKECEKLALEYAKRDAIEKGGKALVQSVTKVQMFQLVQDDIKLSSKIQIIEQDNSGGYGIAKKVMSGDIIKYVAKVRLKIQSADDYNPYREQIARLSGNKITEERQKLEIKENIGKSAVSRPDPVGSTYTDPVSKKERFIFYDLTVLDKETKLMWTRDGNIIDEGMKWDDAIEFIESLNQQKYAGYSDWRLPSKKEFLTLVDFAKGQRHTKNINKYFNKIGFKNVQAGDYWTSTPNADWKGYSRYVSMYDGDVNSCDNTYCNYYVIPVRAGE